MFKNFDYLAVRKSHLPRSDEQKEEPEKRNDIEMEKSEDRKRGTKVDRKSNRKM